jgi:hypothetical protein
LIHAGTDGIAVAGLAADETGGVFAADELCGFAAGLGADWDHAAGRAASKRKRKMRFMTGESPTFF